MSTNQKPFQEEDLKRNHSFKLHLGIPEPVAAHAHVGHVNVNHVAQHEEKRDLKSILKDAGRQLLASIIILIIGFLALNWSAYYQIAQSKWHQWFGSSQTSPLIQLVDDQPMNFVQNLRTSNNPTIQKKQIPPLEMEIAPSDDRIIIPRINQNIPIVKISSDNLIKRDWDALEDQMQKALQDGVVHYPGTSQPGQTGNVVITGHSSYFPWDPGRFKDVFALLHEVVKGDKIVIYFNQDKYIYEVNEIKVVMPDNIEVLKQTPDDRITLITCTPVGTNLKRLIVTAKMLAKNGQPVE